jgi:CheY-like chemotaxis protein
VERCPNQPRCITSVQDASAVTEATIVIVDPDPDARTIYRLILSRPGYACHEARDGDTALTLTRHLRPDVLITETPMPVQKAKSQGTPVLNFSLTMNGLILRVEPFAETAVPARATSS